jgi:hypothetical protein
MADSIDGLNELLKELTVERDQVERQRDSLDFAIERIKLKIGKIIERDLQANLTMNRWNAHDARKSITALSEEILAEQINGMPLPALITELRKRGYEPKAKNVPNTVNSVLHKAGPPFKRLPDGRWTLEQNVSAGTAQEALNGKEETSIH